MQRTTLGELASWEPPPDEQKFYQKFVAIIDEFYPDDWRNWEVNNVTYEDLFGERISSDDECRLRFAVPTIHLGYAFSESSPSLSERKYKRIKRQLITWPLGRAIVYCPFAAMKKVHPIDANNRFPEILPSLKPQLISRSDAAKFFHSICKKSESPSTASSISQKRTRSPGPTMSKKNCNENQESLSEFIKQQNDMLEKLVLLSQVQNENIRVIRDKLSNEPTGSEAEKSVHNDYESSDGESWCAPVVDNVAPKDIFLDFAPKTRETEAKVSVADKTLEKQGINCQRLGMDGWQNIRYADVQKKFQAAPVFTNLKINSNLATVTPPWQFATVLEKMDLCLGAITHGLLQQRKEFQDIYQKASLEVKSEISKKFLSPKSTFRRTSDALLQYTCGKRAEVIKQRREIYKPSNKVLNELLHTIPPSSTHLFSEPQLSELVKEQGGIHNLFPVKYKKPKAVSTEPPKRTEFKDKPRPEESYRKSYYKAPERSTYTMSRTRNNRAKSSKKTRFDGKKF